MRQLSHSCLFPVQWLLLSLWPGLGREPCEGHTVSLCWDKTPLQVLQICKLGKASELKLIKCSGQKIPRNEGGFVRTIPSLVLILKQPGYFSQALDTLRFQYQLVSPGLAVTGLTLIPDLPFIAHPRWTPNLSELQLPICKMRALTGLGCL